MKTNHIIMGLAAVAISLQACTDEVDVRVPVEEGTEIHFGAVLDNDRSRTHYGPEEVVDGQRVWPIYWNHDEVTKDSIFIYSPQAMAGRNQAKYVVNPDGPTQDKASDIQRLGDIGIQTSDAQTYDFYALYPAKYVTGQATGNTISGTLPGSQTCTYAGYTESDAAGNITSTNTSTTLPTAGTGFRTYVMDPNMDYCLMTGKNVGVQISTDPVSIQFSPFSSVIDITVNGPNENNVQDGQTTARVTSIIVEADQPITGDFKVTFDNNGNPTFAVGANASNTLTIPVRALDDQGDEMGIPLMYQNKLNVKAFILPNPNVNSLKVKVVTTDSKSWTKTLNMTGFAPKQIHPVNLPLINLKEGQFDYSIWLSQLDPRIYVSEVSLPGASAAFSAVLGDGNLVKQQTNSLKQLFEAGIRVFQSHVWIENQESSIDHRPTSIVISVNGSPVTINNHHLSLGDVITDLTNEMAQNHSDEFCVLLLSDYSFKNGFISVH